MQYSAKAVANYFISKYGNHKITPLKLQKLVYIAHGWHLALYGDPLVGDEYAEAWQYGPVFPSLYHEFKDLDARPVRRKATDFDLDLDLFVPVVPHNDKQTTALLDRIWDVYGRSTAGQLSTLCHEDDTPWAKIYAKVGGKRNTHIPDEAIADYYKKLHARNRQRPKSN